MTGSGPIGEHSSADSADEAARHHADTGAAAPDHGADSAPPATGRQAHAKDDAAPPPG